jgi:hypothetical protein
MATGNKDFAGNISVYDYRIRFGVPSVTADTQKIEIPYTAFGNPALTSELTTFDYSMDEGATWDGMTPSDDTVLTGLSFSPSGTALTFKWESKTDIGMTMYNTYIRIRMQAESGDIMTDMTMYTLYFERQVIDYSTTQQAIPFPSDYMGVDGTSLLENAPKST